MRPFLLAAFLSVAPLIAAYAGDVTVTEANAKFDHDSITIKAGEAVILTNADNGDHNVSMIDDEGDATDLGVQKPGKTVRVKFDSAGSYKLRCSITPDMKMRVVVN